MELYKYISLGTDCKEWFDYDGQSLPIRPLSTYELDQITLKIIREGITQTTFDSLIKVKLKVLEPDEKVDLTIDNYAEFTKYYNEFDYWTVYYSMKDYQPEDFSKPDFEEEFEEEFEDFDPEKPKGYYIVRKMRYVHQIAEDIKNISMRPKIQLREFIRNNAGKLLASSVHYLNTPLSNKAWKLTPLQQDFLYYSRPDAPMIIDGKQDLPGVKGGSIKDVLKQLDDLGL